MKIVLKRSFTFLLCMIFIYIVGVTGLVALGNKKKKNIFFDEGYKLPTVMAIALNHPQDQNDILVFSLNQERINKLKTIFNHVYLQYDNESYNEFLSKKDSYDRFFTCNWYHGRHQYLNPNKKYCHFEDGAYEYYKDKAFNWLCNKERVEQMFLMFPQYVFDTLKSLPSEAISREKYLEAISVLYNPQPVQNKVIYSLDCPEFLNNAFAKQIINILKNYDNVAIKCHPRDGRKYLWPKNFTILDKSKPFESFYYGFNGIFISSLSSCLHTAKFMKPNSTVICTIYLDSSKNLEESKKYVAMLKELGVLFPKTIAELKSMISQNINKI